MGKMTDDNNGGQNSSTFAKNTTTRETSSNSNASTNSSSRENIVTSNSSASDRIIAEAAKILLKNGLNGTNAAAAATLLTAAAAASFELPTPQPRHSIGSTNSAVIPSSETNGIFPTVSTQKLVTAAIPSATRAVSTSSTIDTNPIDSTQNHFAITDCSSNIKCASNNLHKCSSSNNSGYDMGRHLMSSTNCNASSGGRLQFFKDGKFILELARSKDGDKGGWVSVPRKPFRTPSAATSATVTPTSATTTTYPKNENSTSLSFSDDNSSIQSSPWQRDHSWKQSRPRRGISKGMSLFYQRPKNMVLSKNGITAASNRRRRPYDPTDTTPEMFERLEISLNVDQDKKNTTECENNDKTESETEEKYLNLPKEVTTSATHSDPDKVDCVDSKSELAAEEVPNCDGQEEPKKSVEITQTSEMLNGDIDSQAVVKQLKRDSNFQTDNGVFVDMGRRRKPRAKLNTIIQKLIDSAPIRLENSNKAPLSASLVNSGNSGINNNINQTLAHKVSPPTSATTRLVEHHQQHVSPRKRILREFEKVSLEDTTLNNGAGGKRSRAKGSSSTSQSKASPSRSGVLIGTETSTASTSVSHVASSKSNSTGTLQPNRLNSPYSIHSLLGGNSTSTKKTIDQSTSAIISNVHQQHSIYSSSLYSSIRPMHDSPISSENGGGKSPTQTSLRKRSPPYSAVTSPVQETHSGSPNIALEYASPDVYKIPLVNHASQSLQQLHSTYYPPPYSIPTQYVTSLGAAVSPTTAAHSNRFSTELSPGAVTTTTQSPHIPPGGISALGTREFSPPRSTTASPRDHITTPRTVPKKTASIRREFASPTANSSIRCESPPIRDQLNISPERKQLTNSSQHSATASSTSLHQHMQRGSPSAVAVANSGTPLHYYSLYSAHTSNSGKTSSHASQPISVSSVPSSSSSAMAAAVAAAYIPSVVYPPYISTLAALRQNPLWFHYQTNTLPHPSATTSAAASRIVEPFSPFAYNGFGAAAVAAAAAAAIGQGPAQQSLTASTLMQGMSTQLYQTQFQQQAASALFGTEQRTRTPQSTDSITDNTTSAPKNHQHQHHTSKQHYYTNQVQQQQQSSPTAASAHSLTLYNTDPAIASSSGATHLHNSLRDELSSDVPLNLSKH